MEWVKRNTLRSFGHAERMQNREFTRRVYDNIIKGVGVSGRPPVMWGNGVEEYKRERHR